MSHWVLIEASRPHQFEHVVIGPFPSAAEAGQHLQGSQQVQRMCADDAVDAWTVADDTSRDAATRRWDDAGETWAPYRAVRDADAVALRCTTGTPTGLAVTPSGRLSTRPAPAGGRAR